MMRKSVTPTIEGGLLVAITVILGLVSVYVPIIGLFVEFFCAVPLAVLTARQGAGKGFSALVVVLILMIILIGPLMALQLTLSFGLCGVALGWCFRKNFGAVKIFLATLLASSAAQILAVALLMLIMDVNIIETQIDLVRESFAESFNFYESMGVDQTQLAQAKGQVEPMLQAIAMLVPTIIMFAALINTTAIWFTSKWIFSKLQMKFPTFPAFAEWKFPVIFMYTAAFGALGIYWGFTRGWTLIYEVSLNLTIISMLVGLVQGLSLLSFVLARHNVTKFLRWLLYALIMLNMFLVQLVAITGLVDMIFDYRKRLFKDNDSD